MFDRRCSPPRAPRRECANIFKGKKFEKGIAFPTCVAANRWGRCRVAAGAMRGAPSQVARPASS